MGRPSNDDVNDIQQLAAKYALKMTQKDIHAIMDEVFVPEGTYARSVRSTRSRISRVSSRLRRRGCISPARRYSTSTATRRAVPYRCFSSTRRTTPCAWAGTPTPMSAPTANGA